MCNQLSKYCLLIAFLSLVQIAKAQDNINELSQKSPLMIKLYSGNRERNLEEGILSLHNLTLRIEPRLISENSAYQGWKFQVSEWTATVMSRGDGGISIMVSQPILRMKTFPKAKKGDLFIIKIQGIYFIDSEGNKGEFTESELESLIGGNEITVPYL